jgi:flagellar biosynthesis/type III secretory pathway protein FliH
VIFGSLSAYGDSVTVDLESELELESESDAIDSAAEEEAEQEQEERKGKENGKGKGKEMGKAIGEEPQRDGFECLKMSREKLFVLKVLQKGDNADNGCDNDGDMKIGRIDYNAHKVC